MRTEIICFKCQASTSIAADVLKMVLFGSCDFIRRKICNYAHNSFHEHLVVMLDIDRAQL